MFLSSRSVPLPLFPDTRANTSSKQGVVRLIEYSARLLGLDTHSPQGTRLFGGHSLRVSGAQWLARSGVPLALIQLMARWSSNVISRYLAEVPLETISNVYKDAAAIRDLRTLLMDARRSHEASKLELAEMTAMHREAFLAEMNTIPSSSARAGGEGASSPPFVVKTGGGKTHMVANRSISLVLIFEWKTRCGWSFGLANHCFAHERGPRSACCSVCFRHEDSSTDDSSSS